MGVKMIKTIKAEFFDQFQCLMDKCPDNCCNERWSISIDEATYDKYLDMGIPNLEMKITATKPHTIINQEGKCPFVTEEGLCSIHKEYGEEFLSDTCKAYPRFVSEYGDLFIENIGLSCPASAQWIVSLNRKCRLIEDIYYEDKTETDKSFVKTEAELIMKSILECFYERNSIWESIIECYRKLGGDAIEVMNSKFCEMNSLLLQNISICYLFERIMLQSKKQNPDYRSVIERLVFILKQFEEQCQKNYGECLVYTAEQLSVVLYQIMRKYDHEI